MGKHLLSHYHCRVAGANPRGPRARRFLLENMANVVRQCPFQCFSCRFYCNTEDTFLRHWRSELHAKTLERVSLPRDPFLSPCSLPEERRSERLLLLSDKRQLQVHPVRLLVRGKRGHGVALAGPGPPRRGLDDERLGADHDRPSTGSAVRRLRPPLPLQLAAPYSREGDGPRGELDGERRVSAADQVQVVPASSEVVGGSPAPSALLPRGQDGEGRRRGALFLLVLLDELRHSQGGRPPQKNVEPQGGGEGTQVQRGGRRPPVPPLRGETGEPLGSQEPSPRSPPRALLQASRSPPPGRATSVRFTNVCRFPGARSAARSSPCPKT